MPTVFQKNDKMLIFQIFFCFTRTRVNTGDNIAVYANTYSYSAIYCFNKASFKITAGYAYVMTDEGFSVWRC